MIGNSSSALIESLAVGTPVIVIGGKLFNQNPIPNEINKNLWKLVYNEIELNESLANLKIKIENNSLDLKYNAKQILNSYFEKVTKLSKEF